MLKTWSLKLCPFLTLAMATVGCGKKISENAGSPASQTQNQQRPSSLILRLNSDDQSSLQYRMPQPGRFTIPESLIVRSGNPIGRKVEISYNVDPTFDDDYDYKCNYISKGSSSEMFLDKCLDYNDGNFGDVSEQTFALYQDEIIQVRFTDSSSNPLSLDIIYNMTWF